MNRSGIEARRCSGAALIVAIAGSVHAEVAEEPGGGEAAAQLEATVTDARREAAGIEAVKRAGFEAWEKFHGGDS